MKKYRANFFYSLWGSSRFWILPLRICLVLVLASPVTFVSFLTSTNPVKAGPDTQSNEPLPGHLIVRFQPGPARLLAAELRRNSAGLFGANRQPTLIGRPLDLPILKEAAPDLAYTFQRFGVQTGIAIDPDNGTYLLKGSAEANIWEFLLAASKSKRVLYAEPDYPVYAFREANDPFYRRQEQWGLAKIDIPDAWEITTGSDDITVAVIDSGVGALHPDLEGRVLTGLNFLTTPPTISTLDDAGHGTFVAGVIGANGNNGIGVAGVTWGARILPVKVLNSQGATSNAILAMGINYSAERGAQVINLSLGTPHRSKAVQDAVAKAYTGGSVLVAAAGNDGTSTSQYPAAFDEVIAVGATNTQDRSAPYSNSGPEISVSAPGDSIISLTWAQPSGQMYGYDRGTSFAAPYVSGTVALMLSVNRSLTPSQVRNILENTADYPSSSPSNPVGNNGQGVSPLDVTTPAGSPTSLPTFSAAPFQAASPSPLVTVTPVPTTVLTSTAVPYDPKMGFGRLNAYKAVFAARRNDVFLPRRGQIQIAVSGNIDPGDVQITLNPGDVRVPNADGRLSYSNLPPGTYRLTASSTKYGLPNGTYSLPSYAFQIFGTGLEIQQASFDFSMVDKLLDSDTPVGAFAPVTPVQSVRYFPETGHTLRAPFRQFWEKNGGVLPFGYPISEQFTENGKLVQYFERVVCEFNPDLAGTPFEVQVRRLGSLKTDGRKDEAFAPVDPSSNPAVFYVAETKHTLRGPFLDYWQANGSLATIGLPISEPFYENGRLVQYFEKQRLELHSELADEGYPVLGTLLARDYASSEGLLGKKS